MLSVVDADSRKIFDVNQIASEFMMTCPILTPVIAEVIRWLATYLSL